LTEATPWRRCSACKKPIALGAVYWACNVSTCNQKRTALCFCSVSCWEVHLPGANHREAWAVEKRAPKTAEGGGESTPPASGGTGGVRRLVRAATPASAPAAEKVPREVLIVASRLKDYVRARVGYNTSDRVLEPLSDIVRRVVDEAIENARRDGRMTVLDRDIPSS
jgi:histone H3/H4